MKLGTSLLAISVLGLLSSQPVLAMSKNKQLSKEGEAIAFVVALDKHEIKAANTAMKKKLDSNVDNYASMLKEDHRKNLTETLKLSKSLNIPQNDDKNIEEFKRKGNKELMRIAPLSGDSFETAYIQAMIKGHKSALTKLNRYIKEVTDDSLKQHLMNTKASVAEHLKEGEAIQKVFEELIYFGG